MRSHGEQSRADALGLGEQHLVGASLNDAAAGVGHGHPSRVRGGLSLQLELVGRDRRAPAGLGGRGKLERRDDVDAPAGLPQPVRLSERLHALRSRVDAAEDPAEDVAPELDVDEGLGRR